MAIVTITDKYSGEMLEFPLNTPEQMLAAYLRAKEFEDMAKRIKDKVKPVLPHILDEQGRSDEIDGYMFKQYESQRMTYNKNALRQVFDDDTLDLFLEVSKGKVDSYLKEHQSELTSDDLAQLKDGLEPAGKVVTAIRLEKVA